jgi:apolipoprotein N-acyltransferase
LLVNVSNDAWFGNSLAPHQHLEMARLRALETGRFLVRATNTGISAIIGPDGNLRQRSAQFQAQILRGAVTPRTGSTPFVRWGQWPALLLGVALLLVLLISLRRSPN